MRYEFDGRYDVNTLLKVSVRVRSETVRRLQKLFKVAVKGDRYGIDVA